MSTTTLQCNLNTANKQFYLVNFFIGESLGRRKTMWLAMAWVIVGAILQATAFTVPHLVIGRLITGAGTGIKTSTVPM